MEFYVDAILSDLDGTLVDSFASIWSAWQHWCAKSGVSEEALLPYVHGRPGQEVMRLLIPDLPEGQLQQDLAEMRALEMADVVGTRALPGAYALLSALPETSWAVVTAAITPLGFARIEAAGLPTPLVLIGGELEQPGKPHPAGYLMAASRLGVDPEQCLVLEDAPAGVAAGRAAGARVLGLLTNVSRDELADADAVVPDLTAVSVSVEEEGLHIKIHG